MVNSTFDTKRVEFSFAIEIRLKNVLKSNFEFDKWTLFCYNDFHRISPQKTAFFCVGAIIKNRLFAFGDGLGQRGTSWYKF